MKKLFIVFALLMIFAGIHEVQASSFKDHRMNKQNDFRDSKYYLPDTKHNYDERSKYGPVYSDKIKTRKKPKLYTDKNKKRSNSGGSKQNLDMKKIMQELQEIKALLKQRGN